MDRQIRFFSIGLITILAFVLGNSCSSSARLYGEAYSSFVLRDYAKAMEILDSITKQDEAFLPAFLLKANIYDVQGDPARAEAELLTAAKSPQADEIVFFNLGNLYFRDQEYIKATTAYTSALQLNPRFAKAFLNRANTHMKRKSYRLALDDYESFLVLTPEGYENVRALVVLLRRDLAAIGQ